MVSFSKILSVWSKHLFKVFDSVPGWLVLFLFFVLLFSFPFLDQNEEHHFQYAMQFIRPDWVPGSFVLTEYSETRWVFQYLIGYALQWFSFESVGVGARVLIALLFAIPLGRMLKELNIPVVLFLVVFQLLYLPTQSFTGKEFIFLTAEPKTAAYAFVFWGLWSLQRDKMTQAALFAAISTWFHVLVGGWFFGALVIYSCACKNWRIKIWQGILPYCLLVGPLGYLLFRSWIQQSPLAEGEAVSKVKPNRADTRCSVRSLWRSSW